MNNGLCLSFLRITAETMLCKTLLRKAVSHNFKFFVMVENDSKGHVVRDKRTLFSVTANESNILETVLS